MPTALLSVSDKTGLVDFARTLATQGFTLLSSGGTAGVLQGAGIPVQEVAEYTQAPQMLGGRVKTLHPKIHGGILARRDVEQDRADLAARNIAPIDLVVVNLYPFERDPQIEQIDIGGPALVRAAAKNHAFVTVLVDPSQYDEFLEELRRNGGVTSPGFRYTCAQRAFERTAAYDRAIAEWFNPPTELLPARLSLDLERLQPLRYGENPHQSAGWYRSGPSQGWTTSRIFQGKTLSFNNLIDLEAGRRIASEFTDPVAVIIKHTNPCGVALGKTLSEAYQRAYDADSISAFGGIVALNRTCDVETAQLLAQTFLECVVAPEFTPEALALLAAKKNLRLVALTDATPPTLELKAISGGFLVQQTDQPMGQPDWQVVTIAQPTAEDLEELRFAWQVVKHIKSNAIVVTKERQTLGIGAGQMNRVGSASLALAQAGEAASGGVLASDGFLPFDDTVRTAATAGIRAVVQPGGSVRDEDSIRACNELGLVMVVTGVRHFLH